MALDKKIKYIEELVEKYYDAETTLEEEDILREFFTKEEVPPHLSYEKAQFAYYKQERETSEEITFDVPSKLSSRKRRSKVLNIMNYAAAAIVLVTAGWFSHDKYQAHLKKQQEVKIAYEDTQKALKFLASNFNVGVKKAEKLGEMNKSQKYIIEKKY